MKVKWQRLRSLTPRYGARRRLNRSAAQWGAEIIETPDPILLCCTVLLNSVRFESVVRRQRSRHSQKLGIYCNITGSLLVTQCSRFLDNYPSFFIHYSRLARRQPVHYTGGRRPPASLRFRRPNAQTKKSEKNFLEIQLTSQLELRKFDFESRPRDEIMQNILVYF